MSIVVSVRVGDGLVVATDSASTLVAFGPNGESGVAKVFNHASKLVQLKDYPIAVASWGAGNLGARTISSVIEEYANVRPSLAERTDESLSVEDEARGLLAHLQLVFKKEVEAAESAANTLGVLVGGYSGQEFFPKEYVFSVPSGEFLQLRTPLPEGRQNFGADWYGMTDACVRLHHGRDESLSAILKDSGIDDDTVKNVMLKLQQDVQYKIPFPAMPLQDAVDYAMYMVGVVVGRFRFALGPELCGGPIDVATITRDQGFNWIQKKHLAARPFGPQI